MNKEIEKSVRSALDYKIVELEWTGGALYVNGIDFSYEVDLVKEAIQSVVGPYVIKDSCLRGTEKEKICHRGFTYNDKCPI